MQIYFPNTPKFKGKILEKTSNVKKENKKVNANESVKLRKK